MPAAYLDIYTQYKYTSVYLSIQNTVPDRSLNIRHPSIKIVTQLVVVIFKPIIEIHYFIKFNIKYAIQYIAKREELNEMVHRRIEEEIY